MAMDLPVLPIASQAVDIAAQSRGNLSFIFGHGNSGQIMSFIERKWEESFSSFTYVTNLDLTEYLK